MSRSDVTHIKRLAERLGARDSDVIRFAVKQLLAQLTMLIDPNVGGRALVPVFIESGTELLRHFELDAARLSAIINEGVEHEQRVEPEDVRLIAMNALQRPYLQPRGPGLPRRQDPEDSVGTAGTDDHAAISGQSLENSLRKYLYDKYLYAAAAAPNHGTGA